MAVRWGNQVNQWDITQVLFFDDPSAVDSLPPMLGNLIKSFPEWAEHSNGMAQYIGK